MAGRITVKFAEGEFTKADFDAFVKDFCSCLADSEYQQFVSAVTEFHMAYPWRMELRRQNAVAANG